MRKRLTTLDQDPNAYLQFLKRPDNAQMLSHIRANQNRIQYIWHRIMQDISLQDQFLHLMGDYNKGLGK